MVTPKRPAMLATFTMVPVARASMRGMRARVMAVEDRKLMRMTRSMSPAVMWGMVLRRGTPALFTRMSMCPKASHAVRASSAAAAGSERSAAHICDAGAWTRHASRTSTSLS